VYFVAGKLQELVSKKFSNLCVFSASNVPWLSWGMLQIGIRAQGSTLSLYGPRANVNWENSLLHILFCDEFGGKW
jgi:hypothetical protein